jgi:hypothetical protein
MREAKPVTARSSSNLHAAADWTGPAAGRPVRRPRRRAPPPRLRPLERARRIAWIALAICMVPIATSYLTTMAGPSNSSFTIRSVEWLRDHGGAGLASTLEGIYYSWNAPSTGGPALRRLPTRAHRVAASHPPDLLPVISPALPGEGVWTPTESWTGQGSPVQITQFRSDPLYPQMVAGVAWIDPGRTSISLYAGQLEPSVSMPVRGPMEVPPGHRTTLLATFNSGFKLADANGGWADGGQTYSPLVRGEATFVGYSDGKVNIESWVGGSQAPAGVAFARQNLQLIVDGGRPNPNLSDGPEWGATLGNAIRVWRSGIGITATGDLVYAAADNQTVGSLAAILIHAGAVRAMELDINSYWVTFNSYAEPGAANPSALLPAMTRPVTRYLSPDDRDFFAVYLR